MPVDHHGHPYHFKLFGFPVHIGWQFFLVAYLLSGGAGASLILWIPIVFASVLVHELGHALAFRAFGSDAYIRLWGGGGLTYGTRSVKRWQDAVVSLAGPVPPLLLIGVPAYLLWAFDVFDSPLADTVLYMVWWANLFWSIINLLPILPMDGGRFVETAFSRAAARTTSIISGLGVAAFANLVLGTLFLTLMGLAIAGFNLYMMWREQKAGVYARDARFRARAAEMPGGSGGAKKGAPSPDAAWRALEAGDVAEAQRTMAKITGHAPPALIGTVLVANGDPGGIPLLVTAALAGDEIPGVADRVLTGQGATGHLAAAIAASGSPDALDALDRTRTRLAARGFSAAAAEVGEHQAAMAGADAGRIHYETARTWAKVRDLDRTLASLQRSADLGHATRTLVVGDPGFSPMWDDPRFVEAVSALP